MTCTTASRPTASADDQRRIYEEGPLMAEQIEVTITPVPITGLIGCCIPVVPGTPDIDAPMEQRSELCAVDAHWIVGAAPCCDIHAQVVCAVSGWDWPELWQEAGRSAESVAVPWVERQRHSQEDAQASFDHFTNPSSDKEAPGA